MTDASTVKLLVLSDTHLGFDLPARPRVERLRRGEDFFASYQRALAPALAGEVHAVLHLGDLLYRSKVPAWLVERAVAPLRQVASQGVPVVLLPGNHERSHIPFSLLAAHKGLHIVDRPQTLVLELAGQRVALVGFPNYRDEVRQRFPSLLDATGWQRSPCDLRLLCLHQCIEGMTVGPRNFMFTTANDVIRSRDLPRGFAAVLAGHVHRHQVLRHDRQGQPLAAPVLVPGSIERTSMAEAGEVKGYLMVEFVPGSGGGRLRSHRFVELATRPLVVVRIPDSLIAAEGPLTTWIATTLAALPANAVVTVRWNQPADGLPSSTLRAARLRALAPPTMIVELARPSLRADGTNRI
ncbi:MAG: metallophosphoesterase [Pseudomonadota bacterium]